MKTRMATLLSVAGVLAAGSAAALVNTQVLEGGDDGAVSAEAASVSLQTPADATLASTAAPSTQPSSSTPSTSAPPTTERSSRRSTTTSDPTLGQQVFQVGESGLVTVQREDDTLTVVDATANPGWTVVAASAISPSEIRVVYRSATVEVTFTAATAFGQIGTDVTARSLVSQPAATAPSSNTTPNSTPTTYDDSDDDGYDDDGYDDDDHDDDHDDDDHDDDDHDDDHDDDDHDDDHDEDDDDD